MLRRDGRLGFVTRLEMLLLTRLAEPLEQRSEGIGARHARVCDLDRMLKLVRDQPREPQRRDILADDHEEESIAAGQGDAVLKARLTLSKIARPGGEPDDCIFPLQVCRKTTNRGRFPQ